MLSRLFAGTLACLVLLSQVACADRSVDVVLLGDDARVRLLQECGTRCQSADARFDTPPVGSRPSDVATFSARARHAVIVVDATKGPLPITREHIQVARQAGVPSLSVLFVKADGLDPELLELEGMEMRELMNNYEFKGDDAPLFGDGDPAAAFRAAAALPDRKPLDVERTTGRNASTFVYLLQPQEYSSNLGLALEKGSVARLWVDSQSADAVVTSTQPLKSGDSGELALEFKTAVTTAAGSRFLIEREGKVVAMGVIVELRP